MSVKGDSVFQFKLIYLLLFKMYTYFKIIPFQHFFVVFPQLLFFVFVFLAII